MLIIVWEAFKIQIPGSTLILVVLPALSWAATLTLTLLKAPKEDIVRLLQGSSQPSARHPSQPFANDHPAVYSGF